MHDRDRRRSPFTPPRQRETPVWAIVLVFAVAGYAFFKGYEGWLAQQETKRPGQATQQQERLDVRPPVAAGSGPASAPSQRPLVRCNVDGRTLYTEAPCPAGTEATRTLEDAVRPIPAPHASNGNTTLYHCKAYDGGTFWASSHCNQHRALVDRLVEVPAGLPFDQQVQMAERRRLDAASVAPGAPSITLSASAGGDRASQAWECQQLNQQVAHIDSMARQPLPAWRQDQLRAERQAARDRQFALRC